MEVKLEFKLLADVQNCEGSLHWWQSTGTTALSGFLVGVGSRRFYNFCQMSCHLETPVSAHWRGGGSNLKSQEEKLKHWPLHTQMPLCT